MKAIVAAVVLAGVIASVATAAATKVIGRETASGDYAIAIAAGSATEPQQLQVRITSSPNQSVSGAWTVICTKGFGAGSKSGQFSGRTPLIKTVRMPTRNPDDCTLSASGQLNGSGRIVVTLIAR